VVKALAGLERSPQESGLICNDFGLSNRIVALESALPVSRYVEAGAISKHTQEIPSSRRYESSHSLIFITDTPNHYLIGLVVENLVRMNLAKGTSPIHTTSVTKRAHL
jgi:hypothetical protein